MVKVRATVRGYVGGVLREAGDVFEWPAGDKLGSWVQPLKFGGKGDHDGDGADGGGIPAAPATAIADMTIAALREYAELNGIDLAGLTRKADIVAAIEAGPRQVFGDAPQPQTVAQAMKEVGAIQPDWIAPGSPQPVSN